MNNSINRFNELTDPVIAKYALDSVCDAVMLTDARNRVIDVNPAFTEITGYGRGEILGQSPALLHSDRHEAGFYQAMWDSIAKTGHWRGEILDRRKNGEDFLALLDISTLQDETGQIIRHIGVITDIGPLRAAQEQLERLTHFDALTELPNRRLLTEQLQQSCALARRDSQLLAVIFMDLDGFKAINDHFGHVTGDKLLIAIAQRLRQVVRAGDTVARLGGDEFALIIHGLPNMDELEQVANRILTLAAASIEIDGRQHVLSASLGITVFPFDNADPETLLRHADQAMYQSKQSGRARYHLFDAEQDLLAHSRRQMLDRLRDALAEEEFELYYQPKVNLRSGKVIGVEALLRWRHPERGLVAPGEFLPLIEHDDLIIGIGEWVVRAALAKITEWTAAGLDLPISVNIAARQLQRADFIDCLHGCLADYPDAPYGSLELEILESAALENTAHVRDVINTCQRLGVGFALDDFGTGYASLSYLRDIPADVLKIDQCFVRDVLEDTDDLTLIDGIISLANAFRRIVVAEGVETPEQGVLLMRLGCDIAQGYGIARPMPAHEIPGWVANYHPDPQWGLWADTHWEMVDFPLLVAQYDHIKWVKQIVLYVEGATLQLGEHELIDHHQCRFGHWYYGHGLVRYGQLKEFADLETVHAEVHRIGPEIVRLRAAGELNKARSRIQELLELKDRILEGLSALQKSVATHAAAPLLAKLDR
jgi:diguanylate cyclase (GGDEF)-like protein/PAS domain S-box-containing protein